MSGLAANSVADLITDNCAQHRQGGQRPDIQKTSGGRNSRGDKQGIARKKKADEETRLNKDNCADEKNAAASD